MNEVFETKVTAPIEPVNKFAIPVRYGLMTGFISMFLTTIMFLYVLKIHFMAFAANGFVLMFFPIIFYVIAAKQQKKAFGGVIELKQAFQCIFIVILISSAISAIYGLVYNKYIDPECIPRLKDKAMEFFESMNMPQESLDEQMAKMDAQVADSTKPSKIFYGFAQGIILQSIFGFIVALIVSRKKPAPQY